MTSWEVRLATALAWLAVLPGLGCFYLAYEVSQADPSFLFVVIPIVVLVLAVAGVFLLAAGFVLAVRLQQRHRTARLQTALTGGCVAGAGLLVIGESVPAGLALTLYGGTLVWLMTTPGAVRDLGPWRRAVQQPAPWGSTPGAKVWSPEAPQQGPWSPDPTTLPWLRWDGRSGPRPPWWEIWRTGLAQGIPSWELVVVASSLLGWFVALVLIFVPGARALSVLLMVAGIGGVAVVERRLRARLSGRA